MVSFGPVIKSSTVGIVTINIQPLAYRKILEVRRLLISALAGPSILFQFPNQDQSTYYDPKHPKASEVVNQIADSAKPVVVGVALGTKVSYWRLSLVVDYHNNLNTSFTKNISLENDEYLFSNTAKYLSFSLGYQLIGFQRNE